MEIFYDVHVSLASFIWPWPHFHGSSVKLSFCVLVCFSYTVCNRSTVFGVWNDCKVYMSSWQVSSNPDLIFMVHWSKFSFWVLVFLFNTLCNMSTLFVVWKYFMVYMSIAQVLFDLDLIFTVHCSVLSFHSQKLVVALLINIHNM